MIPACVVQTRSLLGESALWVPGEQRLYWVDLRAPAIHRFDPAGGHDEVWPLSLPVPLGGIVRGRRSLLLATRGGVMRCDFDKRQLVLWTQPNDRPADTAFNDGKVDRDGRLWLGSKHLDESQAVGRLYRVAPDGTAAVADAGFVCSNGPAFSPDGRVLYFADTTEQRIYAYDLDPASGTLTKRRQFARFTPEEGEPDGMTTDAEGGLWVCHWGGWRVTRFDADGRRDRMVAMPVPNVTSCCFGGTNLSTLFITTASVDMTPDIAETATLAGSLFVVEPGIAGLEEPVFQA